MWLYRWYALVFSTLVCLAGWAVVYSLPNQYQVSAKIFVDTRSMIRPLLQGLVINDSLLQDTIAVMRRTLLTRPTLEELMRRTDLDLTAKTPQDLDKLIGEVTSKISISTDKSASESDVYQISYTNPDPRVAKKLVDELLNILLESALGDTRLDRASAQQFLEQQIADYERRLIEAEERMKEFKRKNMGLMPGSGQDYYARLQQASSELAAVEVELKQAQRRRDELNRQLAGEEPIFGIMNEVYAENPQLLAVNARISAMTTRLDELLVNYTEKHPDVVTIRGQIATLEEEKERIRQEMATAIPETSPTAGLSPVAQQLKLSLAEAEAAVAALSSRAEDFAKRVENLQKQANTVPEVEAELLRLDRDYALNKQQYDELLARREAARMSQDADEAAEPVKIKVIDPPRVPLTPIGPKRLLLTSGVFVASLGAALALAFVLSQIFPRVFTRQDLKELTGLPVIGAVTLVRNQFHRNERRMELAMFSLVFLVLVGAYASLVTLQFMNVDLSYYVTRLVGRFV